MSSANRVNFVSSFLIWMRFVFLSLTDLVITSSTMLNRNGKNGHHYLVPDFTGKAFSFSPLSLLAVGLSHMAFIILRYTPLILYLVNVYHNRLLYFTDAFYPPIR